MKYLIDTDWAIDHLNGVEKITQKLEELTLLTNNIKHFEKIKRLEILSRLQS